jgi:hypothetical protein
MARLLLFTNGTQILNPVTMKILHTIKAAALILGVASASLITSARADSTYWSNSFTHTGGVGGGGFNFNNGPVIGNWDNFADFGDLILTAHFDNGVTFDNTASMTSDTIQPWGTDGSTATYGQTFTAPDQVSKLYDFTFFINDNGGGANFLYQAFVMTWSGSLIGGDAVDQSGSSIIYASNPLSYVGNGTVQAITSSIGGGGLTLTAGNNYLFGLTTLGADIVQPTGPGVPDTGSTALLVTLGLGAMAMLRRRTSKA